MVVNNTVIGRIKTSNNRVMIRESQRREDRNQTRFSFSAVVDQTVDVRR